MPQKDKRKRKQNNESSDSDIETRLCLEALEGEMFDIKNKLESACAKIEDQASEITRLKEQINMKSNLCGVLQSRMNDLEQYTRRNSIRIFGLRDNNENETIYETEKVVLGFLNNKLGLKMTPSDIDILHRLGRFSANYDRCVIVKFVSRKSKISVLSQRKKLKGSTISISEDLTSANHQHLQNVRQAECVSQAWSKDGKVFAKDEGGIIVLVPVGANVKSLVEKKRSQHHPNSRGQAEVKKAGSSSVPGSSASSKTAGTTSTAAPPPQPPRRRQDHSQARRGGNYKHAAKSPAGRRADPVASNPDRQLDPAPPCENDVDNVADATFTAHSPTTLSQQDLISTPRNNNSQAKT